MLREVTRTSHIYEITSKLSSIEQWVFLCPDIHWDNPHCKRDLLKRHLDEAVKMGARIVMPGDTFCLMQGAYDPRKQKSDIRPEHNVNHYLDAVVETAAEWFAPYQPYIDIVGLGNHETSILKRMETDVVQRFVSLLNSKAKGGHRVMAGGYGGWYTLMGNMTGSRKSYVIKYYHGSGGGAPVTKGTIQHNRASTQTEGADAIVMGHVHNDYVVTYTREMLDAQYQPVTRDLLMIRCSTYKDEYADGHSGWHVERGGGPRPLGGQFLCVRFHKGWSGSAERKTKPKPSSVVAFSRRAI
jgi:hypothetical protein